MTKNLKYSPSAVPGIHSIPNSDTLNNPIILNNISTILPEFIISITSLLWQPSKSPPLFLKYVRTIVSKTRIDAITAILALHYIRQLKQVCSGDHGSETKVITVALMLANKFLQDTPYASSVWSTVSDFSQPQLNTMEREFLKNINYKLHIQQPALNNFFTKILQMLRNKSPEIWSSCFIPQKVSLTTYSALSSMLLPQSLIPQYTQDIVTQNARPTYSRSSSSTKVSMTSPSKVGATTHSIFSPRQIAALSKRVNKSIKKNPHLSYALLKLHETVKGKPTSLFPPSQFSETTTSHSVTNSKLCGFLT